MKPIEIRLAQRFRFHSKFEGEHEALLYRATHTQTNQRLILKGEENKATKSKRSCLGILQQGKVYQTLQGGIGIPYMHWCGQQDDYNFLALEELDCTLSKQLQKCQSKFSLKTSIMVAKQIVQMLQYFHFKHLCYNNLNPKHIMLGRGQNYNKFYIIDYSKVNRFIDSQQQHSAQPLDRTFQMRIFNMEFSSHHQQFGNFPTRRDDLQSLMYLLAYMLAGQLPWTHQVRNLKKTEIEKCRTVVQIKISEAETLFAGYKELQTLFHYVKGLKFDQKPQYSYFTTQFNLLLERYDLIDDKIYDWIFLQEQPLVELTHKFNFTEGEQEILGRIRKEIAPPQEVRKNSGTGRLQVTAGQKKSDKECNIY